jgi:hypothetical protein
VALAGLAPFGRMLAIVWLGGFPIRGAEALALACLAGAAVRWTVRPGTATDLPARVTIPWLLFAASAVASAAVLYRVSQVHLDYPAVFAERLLTFLAVGYHDLPGDPRPWAEPVGFGYVVATASVVEGVALLLVAGRLCVQSAASLWPRSSPAPRPPPSRWRPSPTRQPPAEPCWTRSSGRSGPNAGPCTSTS